MMARGNPLQITLTMEKPSSVCGGGEATIQNKDNSSLSTYQYDMSGHIEQCVDRYLELADKDVSTLKSVSTPCIDDHQLTEADFETKGELAAVASRIVLKCPFTARMVRLDVLWTVNQLARCVTKWNAACDKRLHRLISYLHHTSHWVQTCWIGDSPEHCKLALFVDASFAGDLQDSKSTSGAILCLTGPQTFVPLSWFCKKQTAVSHSSSEAEVVALDAGVRMEGLPALTLWDAVISVLGAECGGKPPATIVIEQTSIQ